VAANVGSGGAPQKDTKNTGRRWLLPSFLVHDSVEGGEIEKVG